MNTLRPLYVTSAIPYVNAEPHLGHALELIQTDAIARYERSSGKDVRHACGTDDNSLKNVRAAARAGTTPAELVARHGAEFRRLALSLGVEHDDFVHTASDPRHAPAVHALWERCAAAGDVYRKSYRGWYCVGCEHFLRETEIVAGACSVHPEPLELLEEENWFFRLSRHATQLLAIISSDRLQILPKERKHEVCQFIARGLDDFSISRTHARAKGWGIAVPGDDTQIIYVWFDALANYLSGLGFPNDALFEHYWQGQGERWHVIGKDILRFHALYWPAILLSAGLQLPSSLRVHGFITSHGKKLGKSLGNTVDPCRLTARYGVDAVRYYLLAHVHTTKDSDFREELLRTAYQAELSGKLGNLLQRACALWVQNGLQTGDTALEPTLLASLTVTQAEVQRAVANFSLQDALRAIFELIAATNRYVDSTAPWQLGKLSREAATEPERAQAKARLLCCLASVVHVLHGTAHLLAPFLPSTASAIRARLAPEPHLGPPLFAPLAGP